MKLSFLPKTSMGKSSVALMVVNGGIFIVGSLLPSNPSHSGFEIITHNLLQSVLTVIMLIVGISTTSTAFIAVIKNQEYSILVFLAALAGIYGILGFIGSLLNVMFT